MATNYLSPFANGANANVASEETWASDAVRSTLQKGFRSGVARSDLVNRALVQGTSAGFSIGQLVADFAGKDATTDAESLYEGFQEALERFFKAKMFDAIYPVGSIYITTAATDPSTLFGVGSWERIGGGRTLIDAGSSAPAGTTGGSETHQLTINEMPAHSHAGGTDSQGVHSHTRGSMNITGGFTAARRGAAETWNIGGAFYEGWRWNAKIKSGGNDDWGSYYAFDASRNWTGATSQNGAHTHNVSVGNTGGGHAFSIRNPYLAVYIWKRVA